MIPDAEQKDFQVSQVAKWLEDLSQRNEAFRDAFQALKNSIAKAIFGVIGYHLICIPIHLDTILLNTDINRQEILHRERCY